MTECRQLVTTSPGRIEHFEGVPYPVHVIDLETEHLYLLLQSGGLTGGQTGCLVPRVHLNTRILPTFKIPGDEWDSLEEVMQAIVQAHAENQISLELGELKSLLLVHVKPSGLTCLAGTPHENPLEHLIVGVPWGQLRG